MKTIRFVYVPCKYVVLTSNNNEHRSIGRDSSGGFYDVQSKGATASFNSKLRKGVSDGSMTVYEIDASVLGDATHADAFRILNNVYISGVVKPISNEDLLEFIGYFLQFYDGDKGLYPIKGLTIKHIVDGVEKRIKDKPDMDFQGDSMDREMVRNIILDGEIGQL